MKRRPFCARKRPPQPPTHSLSLSPLFARQIGLEKEMADRGRDRYYDGGPQHRTLCGSEYQLRENAPETRH